MSEWNPPAKDLEAASGVWSPPQKDLPQSGQENPASGQPPVSVRPPGLPFAAAPSGGASPSTLEGGSGAAASGAGQSRFDPIEFRKQWKAEQVAKIDEQLAKKKFRGAVAGENIETDAIQGDDRRKLIMARDYLMRDQRAKEAFTLSLEREGDETGPIKPPQQTFSATRLVAADPGVVDVVMDDRRQKLYDDYRRYAIRVDADNAPFLPFSLEEREGRIAAGKWGPREQAQYDGAVLTHASESLRGRELLLEENIAKYGPNETLTAEAQEIVAGKQFLAEEWARYAKQGPRSFAEKMREEAQKLSNARATVQDAMGLDAAAQMEASGTMFRQGGAEVVGNAMVGLARLIDPQDDRQYTFSDRFADFIHENQKDAKTAIADRFKQPIYSEASGFNAESILPQLAQGAGQMSAYMATGELTGGAGLFAMAATSEYENFVQQAIEGGATEKQAENGALAYAPISAAIERFINPQLFKTPGLKEGFQKTLIEGLKSGLAPRNAMKQGFEYIAQQAGQETAEEILQTIAERGTNIAVNELSGTDLNTRITAEEVVNMAIVSSVLGAAGGVAQMPAKRGAERHASRVRAEAAQWAAMNPDLAKEAVAGTQISEVEKKDAVERIDILAKMYKGNGLTDKDPDVAYRVAQNIAEKTAILKDIKEAPMDETLAEAAGDPREAQIARLDQENIEALGLKMPKEEVDADGKKVEEEVKPEPAPQPEPVPEIPEPIVDQEVEQTEEEFLMELVASLREGEQQQPDIQEVEAAEEPVVGQTNEAKSLTQEPAQEPPVPEPAPGVPVDVMADVAPEQPKPARAKRAPERPVRPAAPKAMESAQPKMAAASPYVPDQPFKRVPPKTVTEPLIYTPASFVKVTEQDGDDIRQTTIRGIEYLLPGFEEYRFLVGKDEEGKWGVYEMSTGAAIESGFDTDTKAMRGAMAILERNGKPKLDKLLAAFKPPTAQPEAQQGAQQEDPAKYAKKAKAVADKIRKGKIKGGIQGSVIPTPVWNGVLEVIAKTLEAGGKAADAVSAAVKHLKSTDWYKGAMAEERKAAEDRLRDIEAAQQQFRTVKAAPPKTAINKAAGVTKERRSITVDERTALKDQIRMAAINAEAGAKGAAAQQEAFAGTIRDILAPLTGRMTPAQVKTITTRAAAATTPGKRARFVQYAHKIIDKANYAENLSEAESLRRKIRKAASRASAKKRRGAGVNALAMRFAVLDPEDAPDIQVYLGVAENLLENLRGYNATIVDGSAVKETGVQPLNTDAVLSALDEHEAAASANAKTRTQDEYAALVEAGKAPAGLSPAEVDELLESIEDEQAAERMQARADKRSIREAATTAMAASRQIDLRAYILEQKAAGEDAEVSPEELRLMEELAGIDLDRLNQPRKIRFITMVGDIIHASDTGGLRDFAATYKAQQGISKAFAEKGDRQWRKIKPGVMNALAGTNSFFEWLTKSIDSAWRLRNWIGIDGMNDANQRANTETNKFRAALNRAIDAAGIKHHEAQHYRMRSKMGIYATAIQHRGGTPEERQADFDRAKEMIRQSIANRMSPSSTENNREKGAIEQEVYDKLLATANNVEELRANVMADDARIIPVVDAAISGFEAMRDKNFSSFNLDFNELPEEWENYTPISQIKVNGESSQDVDANNPFADKYMNLGAVKPKRGSASFERTGGVRTGYAIDMDFIGNVLDKFHEAAYKAEVSQYLAVVREFMADPRSIELLTPESHNTLMRNLRHAVKLQTGELDESNPDAAWVMRGFDRWGRRAAGIALKGVAQLPKQAMVSINTAMNLGTDADLMAASGGDAIKSRIDKDSPQRRMVELFQISNRGETMAGLEKIGDAIRGGAPTTSTAPEAAQWLNGKMGEWWRMTDKLFVPLVESDVFSARTAWFAYYRKHLRQKGKQFTGWEAEAASPDQDAASYANQMVERTQGANSPSTTPIAYNSPDALRVVMKMILPFSSFPMNMRMRFFNDVAVLTNRNSSTADRATAGRDLLGTLAETMAYNALKIYGISVLVQAGGVALANLLMGEGDDEEKETQERMKRSREGKRLEKFVGTTASDLIIGGLPGLGKESIEAGANWLYQRYAPLRNVEGENMLPNAPFYGVSDKPQLGTFGAAIDEASNMMYTGPLAVKGSTTRIDDGTFSTFDDLGTQLLKQQRGVTGEYDASFTEDHPMTPQERFTASYLTIMSGLGLLGLSDAELRSVNRTVMERLKREMARTHGEVKEGARRFVPARN